MNEQDILYSTLLLVNTLVALVVAGIVWRRRTATGAKAMTTYMVAIACWSASYALFWANVYPSRAFWLNVTYFGAVTVTPAFFIFTVQYTHREKWLTRAVYALLLTMAALTFIMLWTDSWHGLFFAGKRSPTDSTFYDGGPWFWINLLYSYSLFLFGIALLIRSFLSAHGLYRRQIGLILAAALIPWFANVISLIKLNPLPALDLTPLAFLLTGLIIAFVLLNYLFLDVVPVARDKLIENMKDGILVLDQQNRIVDANPALFTLLGSKTSSIFGQSVEQLLADWPHLQAVSGENPLGQEIRLGDNPAKYLNMRLISLKDRQEKEQGKLIILQDVTARKQLEAEREELITTLQTTLGQVKTLSGLLPICAGCKKIRDDQGYWQDVAVYVRDHTDAEFTHGMCPDCMEKYYPGYAQRKKA